MPDLSAAVRPRPLWQPRQQDVEVFGQALSDGHSPFLAGILAGRIRSGDGGLSGLSGRLADIPP
ncbi:MAG TPA: hypothetical protein PLR59_13650, partial [Brevundimonas sp.]|nr:hypothetical protein [Brevundimonas sp.]